MLIQSLIAGSQMISFNPILNENTLAKNHYGNALKGFLELYKHHTNRFWNRWEIEEENLYKQLLLFPQETTAAKFASSFNGALYFLTDIAALTGYDPYIFLSDKMDVLFSRITKHFNKKEKLFFESLRYALGYALSGDFQRWSWLENRPLYAPIKNYLDMVANNIKFINQTPFKILVTATMSAGKSTFINALVGTKICRSQNMACTAKIHNIIAKPYDDGYISKIDSDLILNADEKTLLEDNPQNVSDKIHVATHFNSELSGVRTILQDSPGVNASEHEEHKNITEQAIERNKFDLLIYVMNTTQLFTEDENAHIDFIKETCQHNKVIFVVNKIDMIDPDEENILAIMEGVRNYVIQKGFENPIICPASSLAGFLVKNFRLQKLNRIDERRLYNLVDKFAKMNLVDYYQKYFKFVKFQPQNSEEEQLLNTSGFSGVEKIIRYLILFNRKEV